MPDKYVIGYGLNCENSFRNLPYIALFGAVNFADLALLTIVKGKEGSCL